MQARMKRFTGPKGSRGNQTGTGIEGRNMAPLDGTDPVLGDGWTHEGGTAFRFIAGADPTASITFSGAVPGKAYRVVTNLVEINGSLPRIDVEIGAQLFYAMTEPGLFSEVFKALGTTLTFTVNTAVTTTDALIKQILVVEV